MNTKTEPQNNTAGSVFHGVALVASVFLVFQLFPAAFIVSVIGWWAAFFIGFDSTKEERKLIRPARKALFRMSLYCLMVVVLILLTLFVSAAGPFINANEVETIYNDLGILGFFRIDVWEFLLRNFEGYDSYYKYMMHYRIAFAGAGFVVLFVNFIFSIFFFIANVRRFLKVVKQNDGIDRESLPSAYNPNK